MNLEEKKAKYLALCHAMQTGVAYKMERDAKDTTPKHLRVGINVAMVDHSALVSLLIKKRLITEDEYYDELIEAMGREVEMYQSTLLKLYGANPDAKLTLI